MPDEIKEEFFPDEEIPPEDLFATDGEEIEPEITFKKKTMSLTE